MGLALIFNHHCIQAPICDQDYSYIGDGDARGRLPPAHTSQPGQREVRTSQGGQSSYGPRGQSFYRGKSKNPSLHALRKFIVNIDYDKSIGNIVLGLAD